MKQQLAKIGVVMLLAMTAQAATAKGRPESKIPGHAKGPEIIEKLGSKLPEVARFYDMTAEQFRELVDHDHSVHTDETGRLYYICEGMVVEAEGLSNKSSSFAGTTAAEDPFNLSSIPGADLTIYLDFDGHTTRSTSWNSRVGGADIVTPPYDIDGNPQSFSDQELANIFSMWKRVSDDFAPWSVNVTTVDPGAAALSRSSSNDTQFGIRVVIGGSSSDWYGNAGGVAYIGSFTWTSDTPCFVFAKDLGNGTTKYTGEAISHEIGHTFGLHHDGSNTTAYYQGHNNWAPIMGVGYYRPTVQWSKGEYANANNKEDDIARITSIVPLRADLLADDMQTTAGLPQGIFVEVIESESDADVLTFQTSGGDVSIQAETPFEGNLNVRLALYNAQGNLILADSPGDSMEAELVTNLPAGTYFVLVEGVAPGNPDTGYTEYGSIGFYRLRSSFPTSSNQAPSANATSNISSGRAPVSVQFSSNGSSDPDGTLTSYHWDFGDGSSSTSANPSHTFNTAGNYTVSLIVVDNEGASGQDTVTVSVTAPQAPDADASATTPTSGTAPLTVELNGTRSSDADGYITAFNWSISTGAAASGSTASYTFNEPGTYTVTLSVSDNEGLSSSDTVTIQVNEPSPPPVQEELFVENVSVSVSGNSKKGYTATAKATVVDANGRSVRGATVYGRFSGAVTDSVSGNSGRRGDVTFRSSKFRNNGSVSFEVTDIQMEGYIFVP